MKKAAAHRTTPASGNDHFSLSTLALDLLDTTWRIAVPVVFFAAIGLFIDNALTSGPWCTLLGTVAGFIVAGLLLKRQLQAVERIEREDSKK